jgi:hypothetical protein
MCKSIEPLESIQPAPTHTVFQCTTIPAKRADDPPQEKQAATESTIRRWKKADLELWTDGWQRSHSVLVRPSKKKTGPPWEYLRALS